jgi:hypothetical protein
MIGGEAGDTGRALAAGGPGREGISPARLASPRLLDSVG